MTLECFHEEANFDTSGLPTAFDPEDLEQVDLDGTWRDGELTWTCPICGETHRERLDAATADPDPDLGDL